MARHTHQTHQTGGTTRAAEAAWVPTGAAWRVTLRLAARQLDYWATVYRRTWKGSAVSSFLLPVLYLTAMGVGLGSFIDSPGARAQLGGVSYLEYVAPGLLAATAMQTAMGESTYPVFGNFKWTKVYPAMVTTPLGVPSVLLAHLCYVAFRLLTTCAVFLVVITVFGLVPRLALAPLAVLVAVVIGLAHATPVFAFAARLREASGFSVLFRLGVVPMFLFSGAFFPVSQLPRLFEWLSYATPLYHGVELSRMFTTGDVAVGIGALHLAYLLLWLLVGWVLALRAFRRRLMH